MSGMEDILNMLIIQHAERVLNSSEWKLSR